MMVRMITFANLLTAAVAAPAGDRVAGIPVARLLREHLGDDGVGRRPVGAAERDSFVVVAPHLA
eukprot:COSAG06_NODE_46059_length_350_cov_0.402390_1_plen_63_part_10